MHTVQAEGVSFEMPVGQGDRDLDDDAEFFQVLAIDVVADAEDALPSAEEVIHEDSVAAQLSVVVFLDFAEFPNGLALGAEDGRWTYSRDPNISEVREHRPVDDGVARSERHEIGQPGRIEDRLVVRSAPIHFR
jgi:hypothetical protein